MPETMPVRALWFSGGRLHLIDQRQLPGRKKILHLSRVEQVAQAIRTLTVRGAPAIGVAAAYGMVLAAKQPHGSPEGAARMLRSTRPTAYDLFVGIETVRTAWANGKDPLRTANAYRARIVEECHEIGRVGAALFRTRRRVLTHCNAGALATVEWGTSLAPLRVARDRGTSIFVWVDETRPLLQGSRLTAWELQEEGIPYAVIVDNAAGYFMQSGQVDAVLVGADRIARNGDFANKIGTYEKAVLAKENGIPFYVAAPWSTFDLSRPNGASIPVEERKGAEVLRIGGKALAPAGSTARNPAFDVTPARFVTAFITPGGVVSPAKVAGLVRRQSPFAAASTGESKGRLALERP
jgi:S-methyl-5-thioribose-1-phosphate isomerase